jgi:sugar phosphate isomerase/epimerase
MDGVGIEYQTVLGYPPLEFVHLAADLGCRSISMKACTGPHSPYDPYGYGTFSFLDDASLRRRMVAALDERDVSISLAEGFVVLPGVDLVDDLASLDVMCDLGARRANAVTLDPDLGRSFDQLAAFAEVAADRGMQTTLEFSKSLTVSDLDTALAAVRHVGRSDFKLLIDTMHVVRSGSTAADLAALDSSLFGYVQLCDSTLEQRNEVYRDDSSDRSVPGEGELPLVEILRALPEELPIGVEVPMRSRAAEGVSAQECARRAVAGAQAVLAEATTRRRIQTRTGAR